MTAAISATVTTSVSMSGAPFSSAATAITGDTASIIENTYPSTSALGTGNGTAVPVTGVGFAPSTLELLYLLSDEADVDVTFTGTGGTPNTLRILAGTPVIYNIVGGIENPINTATGTISMSITNNGSQALATDFHGRLIYSAP